MKNSIRTAAIIAIMTTATNTHAQEITPTPAPTPTQTVEAVMAMIAPICAIKKRIVLSQKAQNACEGLEKDMPKLTKKGDRLTKGRTGAEFTTLLANIAFFQ